MRDRDELDEAIQATRNLGISAKRREGARDEELRHLHDRLNANLAAIEAGHVIARERDETQKLLDRALAQVAERDAQLRNQELTISHLHGQVAALKDVFAMGQQAATQAMFGPQIGAVTQEFELQGLDEDDVPPRREEPALTVAMQRVVDQLKSAGIDTSSICHYEWDDDDNVCGKHACGMVNPLHLGDHACERECGATCSQQEAERIEEAKQRAT